MIYVVQFLRVDRGKVLIIKQIDTLKKSWVEAKKSVAPNRLSAILNTSTAHCTLRNEKQNIKNMTAKNTASTVDSTVAAAPTPATKPAKTKPSKAPAKTKTKAPAKKNAVKRGPGRPKASLKLILNKAFSVDDLVALNPDNHELTVRRHISDGVKSGVFTKLAKKVNTGKRGKPADLFINSKVLSANRANLAKVKAKADAVVADATVNA